MEPNEVNETFAEGFLFGLIVAVIIEAAGAGILYGCYELAKWMVKI